jgi:hypothetical protein
MYQIARLQQEEENKKHGAEEISAAARKRSSQEEPQHHGRDSPRDKKHRDKLHLAAPLSPQHASGQQQSNPKVGKGGVQLAPAFDPTTKDACGSSRRVKGAEGLQLAPPIPYTPRGNTDEPLENPELSISGVAGDDQQDDDVEANSPVDTSVPPAEAAPAAIEGVLAPTVEETRVRMLEEAIEARNVHRVTAKKSRRWITVAVVVIVLVLAAVGATLGAVLGGNGDNKAKPTEEPTQIPTSPPTPIPTSPRFAGVASFIEFSFGTVLDDPSSPQYRAAEWLADVDTTFDLSDEDRFRQRYAVVVFYYATGGDTSWIQQMNFLSPGVDECDWNEPPGDHVTFDIDYNLGLVCSDLEKQSIDDITICKSAPCLYPCVVKLRNRLS